MSPRTEAAETSLAFLSAIAPELNAATIARMPTFSIIIEIKELNQAKALFGPQILHVRFIGRTAPNLKRTYPSADTG